MGETGIAGEVLDQSCAVAFPKAVQRQHRHMRRPAPGVLGFGAEGNDKQDVQPGDPIKYQIEQLARARVDPMCIFKYHQYRPAAREGFKLMEQCLQQLLTFALGLKLRLAAELGNDSSSANNSISSSPRAPDASNPRSFPSF